MRFPITVTYGCLSIVFHRDSGEQLVLTFPSGSTITHAIEGVAAHFHCDMKNVRLVVDNKQVLTEFTDPIPFSLLRELSLSFASGEVRTLTVTTSTLVQAVTAQIARESRDYAIALFHRGTKLHDETQVGEIALPWTTTLALEVRKVEQLDPQALIMITVTLVPSGRTVNITAMAGEKLVAMLPALRRCWGFTGDAVEFVVAEGTEWRPIKEKETIGKVQIKGRRLGLREGVAVTAVDETGTFTFVGRDDVFRMQFRPRTTVAEAKGKIAILLTVDANSITLFMAGKLLRDTFLLQRVARKGRPITIWLAETEQI